MDEALKIKSNIKNKRKNLILNKTNKFPIIENNNLIKILNKLMITVALTLITLILLTKNPNFKKMFYKNIYEKNISFAKINQIYQEKFGLPIPLKNLFKSKTIPVFNEKLKYEKIIPYKEGIKLIVDPNYLVPALRSGIVIFIGDKLEYKNTIIIQQNDGIEAWYSNIKNKNVQMYDYIDQGTLLGEVEKELILQFNKNGKTIDYQPYL